MQPVGHASETDIDDLAPGLRLIFDQSRHGSNDNCFVDRHVD